MITIMEGREGERPNSYDLRGHGNSLLELQHLVFMLHNVSRSKVTTGIFCPQDSGEEGKRLMQNQGSTAEPALSKEPAFEDLIVLEAISVGKSLYIYKASQVGGKCRKFFIRLCFKYSSYSVTECTVIPA